MEPKEKGGGPRAKKRRRRRRSSGVPAVRHAKPPFPINLIWNIKAFYFVFMVVMIASLAAVGLAPGLGGGGASQPAPVDEGSPLPEETGTGLLTFDKAEKTIDTTKAYNAVITADKGEIVVALSPDAPQAANRYTAASSLSR